MSDRVLLVEGDDDRHVMWNLFEVRRIPVAFTVELPNPGGRDRDNGGVEMLLDSLPIWLRAADLQRLAVVIDADVDPARRWQSIRDRLVRNGVDNVPDSCMPGGTVADVRIPPEPKKPVRFGVWIMPDNQSSGMLEDFVAAMIPEEDAMLPHVERFLASIRPDARRFSDAHESKARIHSWLAVSDRPGRPMGQAIKADRNLDANCASVRLFLDWVHSALIE